MLSCKRIKLIRFYTTLFCPNQGPSFFSPLKTYTTTTPYNALEITHCFNYHGNIIFVEVFKRSTLSGFFSLVSNVFLSLDPTVARPANSALNPNMEDQAAPTTEKGLVVYARLSFTIICLHWSLCKT